MATGGLTFIVHTSYSVDVSASSSVLQPTLWRTCRALANVPRLKMLRLLARRPGLTVSQIAQELGLTLSASSHYLRLLESRGVLEVARAGRFVKYRVTPETRGTPPARLAALLVQSLAGDADDCAETFRKLTAFTHPRRIELVKTLRGDRLTARQLGARSRISHGAMSRHLRKLKSRGLIVEKGALIQPAVATDPLTSHLMKLVDESGEPGRSG
jgi:DNA-binding transcriptional ArsR family regulator